MTGRRAARIGATVALAAAVVLLLDYRFLLLKRSADHRIGVTVRDTAGGLVIDEVSVRGPAARGGVAKGDRILTVAGRPVGKDADYDAIADSFQRGRPVAFSVRRDGHTIALAIVPGMPAQWLPAALDGIVAICYLALATLALYQRQRDLRASLLVAFSAAVAVELCLPGELVGQHAVALAVSAAFYLLTGVQFGLFVHLVAVTPRRAAWLRRRGWMIPTIYVLGIAVAGVVGATVVAQGMGMRPLIWTGDQADWFLNSIGLAVWALLIVTILTLQVRAAPVPVERQQAALVLAGATPWAAFMVVTGTLAVAGVDLPDWVFLFQQPFLLCFPVAVFVAIFRYQLLDLELVVRRSMVYTALTGALLLVFYAAVGAGGALLSQWVEGSASVVVVSGATLLLGLLFSPLRSWLQRLIDRRFFPERHAQRQRLVALAAELPALGKVPAMGTYLVGQLTAIFAAQSATLLLADPTSGVLLTVASTVVNPERDFDQSFLLAPDDPGVEALRRARRPMPAPPLARCSASLAQRMHLFTAELVVPVMHQEDLIGLLLLGGKASGETYRAEEVELLTLLAHHIATVFENARLFESATTDGLTGLLRREVAIEQLRRELQRAQRHGRPLAVGMADLDNFKPINDVYGHLVGDALLKLVAQAMRAGLRNADCIGRYGGEEFLLVLPETDRSGAMAVAEKVRATVERIRLPIEDRPSLRVTLSIGLADLTEVRADGDVGVESLIARADENLMRAKETGRNRIVAADVAGEPGR
jgi:diguanylate cyclase (GGDEF)-like protein